MASTNVGSIHYDLQLKTDSFDKAINGITNKMNSIGNKMIETGKTMTKGITLPVAAGFAYAVKSASDLNETLNKVDVAFKTQAKNVVEWSKTSLRSMGLAQQSALDAAALFGDMSTAMGLNTKEAAKMSMQLTQLGADLASFKNISFDRAQTALAGVYTGETEALKGLGIVMTEANLQAFAMSKGIKKNIQGMTQAEKVQLRFAYVMSVTKNAQGDFTRTSAGTANQMRMTQERFKELSAEVGQKLLPIANRLMEMLNGLMSRFQGLSPATQNFILAVVGIAAVLGPVIIVMGHLVLAIKAIAGAFMFLAANPVVLAVALIILAIAALAYVVIRNWDTLKRWFGVFWNWLKNNWQYVLGALTGGLGFLVIAFIKNFSTIRAVVGGAIGKVHESVKNGLANALQAIWNYHGRFVDAGWGLITAFANGVRDAFGRAVNAVKSGMTEVRQYLPFSDAKKGPLSDLTLSGKRFAETFAQGIYQGSGAISAAVGNSLATPLSQSQKQQTNNVNTSIYGNINIGSNADGDNFMRQLARNQELALKSIATRPGSLG
jgi:hypothetical protein